MRAPAPDGLPGAQASSATFGAVPGQALSVRVTISWQPPARAVRDATGRARAEVLRTQHVTLTAL